jgi:hypothetical protein
MNDIDKTKRLKLSKQLYYFAWGIEVIAVAIGLAISIMIGIDTYSNIKAIAGENTGGFASVLNSGIAIAPFLLVALVEIAKIPVATAAYQTSRASYKFLFFFVLIFLAGITFETSFNGFERNFSNLTYVINSYKQDLVAEGENIANLELEKTITAELTAEKIEKEFNDRRNQMVDERDRNIEVVQQQIGDLKASTDSKSNNTKLEQVELKRAEVVAIRADRDAEREFAKGNYNERTNNIVADIRRRTNSLSEQLQQKQNEITAAYARRQKEIDDAGLFGTGAARRRNDEDIARLKEQEARIQEQLNNLDPQSLNEAALASYNSELENIASKSASEITRLENEIANLLQEVARNEALVEQDIKPVLDQHFAEIRRIDGQYQSQATDNEAERDRLMDKLKNNQQTIDGLDADLVAARKRQTILRDTINEKVGDNQVYRMTQAWTGKESAADVSRDEVALTGIIWFGSLALVIALTGIFLALASCVVGDIDAEQKAAKQSSGNLFGKLLTSARRMFVAGNKYIRSPRTKIVHKQTFVPKEVVREVPVDRVVKHEVPKEVIKKILVHVPMYTTDIDLVKRYSAKVDDGVSSLGTVREDKE